MVLERIRKIVKIIETWFLYFTSALVFMTMFYTVSNVVGRYIFNYPLKGYYETAELSVLSVTLLGLAYTLRVGGHVAVDMVTSRLSPRSAGMISAVMCFVAIVFSGSLIYPFIDFGNFQRMVKTTSDELGIPLFIFFYMASFAFFLFAVEAFFLFWDKLAIAGGRGEAARVEAVVDREL